MQRLPGIRSEEAWDRLFDGSAEFGSAGATDCQRRAEQFTRMAGMLPRHGGVVVAISAESRLDAGRRLAGERGESTQRGGAPFRIA